MPRRSAESPPSCSIAALSPALLSTVSLLPPIATLLAVLLLAPPALHAGWEEGVAAYRAGDLDTALAELRAVTESRPNFVGGHLMVGQVLSQLGRWAEASRSFARAFELDSDPKPGLILPWSRALIESNQPDEAVALLGRLDRGRLSPDQRTPYDALISRALTQSAQPVRAIERLEQLTRAHPDSGVLWQALGRLLAQANRPAEAAEAFERALDLADGNPAIARSYVTSAFQAARISDGPDRQQWYGHAAQAAERLVRSDPSEDNWLLMGEARLGALDYREAVAAFEKAAAAAPKDPLPDYYLGEAFFGLEQGDRAIWVLRDALRKHPGDDLERRIHISLARAHHLEKEYLQAAREYRAVGDEEHAALMEHYQRLSEINDRVDRDRQACEQALSDLEKLMASSQDLRGTPEWRQLEADKARLVKACG